MRLLALILFLLTAAAASAQQGIYMQVPEDREPPSGPTLMVRLSASGTASVDGVASDSAAISTAVREHIGNHSDGVVAFASERHVGYARYIEALDTVKAAFLAERDKVARTEFGLPYSVLKEPERSVVHEQVPLRISLAEPE